MTNSEKTQLTSNSMSPEEIERLKCLLSESLSVVAKMRNMFQPGVFAEWDALADRIVKAIGAQPAYATSHETREGPIEVRVATYADGREVWQAARYLPPQTFPIELDDGTCMSVPRERIRIRGTEPPAQKALQQRIGPTEPNNDMVICPHCTSQFVAVPVNDQKRLAAPQAIPCECTTYCLHSGYPDAPLRRGVFCRENAQKVVSERRCVCGLVVVPEGELRVEIGSTTTTHRLAGPCFQTPAQSEGEQ